MDWASTRRRLLWIDDAGHAREAVVNGRTLRVGRQMQGASLAAIEPDSATFQLGQHKCVVMLKQ